MKKSTKILIVLLIVGTVGLAAMLCAIVGTGMLYSREATQTYEFGESPIGVVLDIRSASIVCVPTDECRVEAYVKAWRPEEISMDDVLSVSMVNGILQIEEKGFPADFLGYFPQPYEIKLTVYASQAALDAMRGELQ